MTPHEEKVRAEDAKQLLANPMLTTILREMEAKLIEQLAAVEIAPDKVARLQAILAAKRMFERSLKTAIQTGQLVIEEERRRSLAQRVFDRIPR